MGTAPILGTTLGEENTYARWPAARPPVRVTFARVSTDDVMDACGLYVGKAVHR